MPLPTRPGHDFVPSPAFDLPTSFDAETQYSIVPTFNWGLPLYDLPKDAALPLPLPAPTANAFDLSFAPPQFNFNTQQSYSFSNLPTIPAVAGLPSPLAFDSGDYNDFFNFDDAGEEECPGLEDDLEDDLPESSPEGSPLFAAPADPASVPLVHLDAATSAAACPSPAPATRPAPRHRGPSTRATGFRGASTKLVPLDAPIQSRSYLVPSATSRKRKTTAVERALLKRQCGGSGTPVPESPAFEEVEEEEIPDDLLAAAERKRIQNTLAARKSRQRKQGRLAQLEEENKALKSENEKLKGRVDELEKLTEALSL